MRTGNAIVLIGVLMVAAGVLGGEALPWFKLQYSEIVLAGMEFNLGLVLLALCGISTLFTLAGFVTRDRVYAVSSTITSLLIMVAMAYYYFNAPELLGLPATEVARAGNGYLIILGGSGVILFGTLWVYASNFTWARETPLLRVAVILNGAVIDERYLLEQKDLIVGGKAKKGFFESPLFFVLFAVGTAVLPALVFGPMISDYAAGRRRRRYLHIPTGNYPDGKKMFVVGKRGTAKVGLTSDLGGKLRVDGTEHNVRDYVAKNTAAASGLNYATVSGDDWGVLKLLPQVGVFFQMTPIDDRVARKSMFAFDRNVAATTSLSALVQVGLILMTLFVWREDAVKVKKPDVRKLMKVDIMTSIEEEPEELEELGEEEEDVGKKAEGEEGKFGDPDIEPEIESKVPKRDGKMVDKIDPKKVGLNDLLSSQKNNAIASILSADTDAFSNKIAVAMSGTGSEFVLGHGSGGLGFKGTGTGGGGTGGFGRIHGLGEIDTGGGKGVSVGLGKKKKKRVGKLKIGSGSSQGFCKKSDITKNVRRRAGAIRACYERELQVKPKLKGKVTARWTITLDGRVSNASVVKSSLKNKAVEGCLLRTVRRMRFAKPEGGVCVIQWPFVFNSGS